MTEENFVNSFCFELEQGQTVYKGLKVKYNSSHKNSIWVCADPQNAQKYGIVHKLKTTRPLKLINITSRIFRYHYLDNINFLVHGNDMFKENICLPIGLPDSVIQKSILTHNNEPVYSSQSKEDITAIDYYSSYIGFHRFSNTQKDKLMLGMIKNIYSKYGVDGYIQPFKVFSCWHGTFNEEIALFSSEDLELVEKCKQLGGTKKYNTTKVDIKRFPTPEELRQTIQKTIKAREESRKEIDSLLKSPTLTQSEIDAYIQSVLQKSQTQTMD